jgi:transposase InsO family protein
VEPDLRDAVVDFIRRWAEKTGLAVERLLEWLGLNVGKFYEWRQRYGRTNQHNGSVPRDFWLQLWEKQAILDFQQLYPLEGYRRLTYMMIDADVVAVSPSSVFRVLHEAGRLRQWAHKTSKKGTGFEQPLEPHEHWHVDIAHINIHGTFYYLCAVLDGASRYLLAWSLRESMTEADVEIVIQRARERFPNARPRIISDNGPQFIAKDFKEFIRISGMTHVRTSPYYPQSNGKLERWNQSIKSECIRPGVPLSVEDAERLITQYVTVYNEQRLHSSLGYITPLARLQGRQHEIHAARDRKLEQARRQREQDARNSCSSEKVA